MFYPDFFEGLTSSTTSSSSTTTSPPPPPPPPPVPEMTRFRSSHEISGATIGSMASEFVDLMKSGDSFNVLEMVASSSKSAESMSSLVIDGMKFPSLQKADFDWLVNTDDEDEDDDDLYPEYCNNNNNNNNAPPPPPPVAPIIRRMSSRLLTKKPTKVVMAHKANKPTYEKPKRQRKVYDIAANQREYVQYTDADVLCQRGGLGNQHAGNKRYLQAKQALQVVYQATPKSGRTAVAQQLVDAVRAWGGRFLTKDADTGGWYEIHNHKARTKASQALREDYSPEELRAKRKKYKAGRNQSSNNAKE